MTETHSSAISTYPAIISSSPVDLLTDALLALVSLSKVWPDLQGAGFISTPTTDLKKLFAVSQRVSSRAKGHWRLLFVPDSKLFKHLCFLFMMYLANLKAGWKSKTARVYLNGYLDARITGQQKFPLKFLWQLIKLFGICIINTNPWHIDGEERREEQIKQHQQRLVQPHISDCSENCDSPIWIQDFQQWLLKQEVFLQHVAIGSEERPVTQHIHFLSLSHPVPPSNNVQGQSGRFMVASQREHLLVVSHFQLGILGLGLLSHSWVSSPYLSRGVGGNRKGWSAVCCFPTASLGLRTGVSWPPGRAAWNLGGRWQR